MHTKSVVLFVLSCGLGLTASAQTQHQNLLAPGMLDQVRSVRTLGDASRILGSAQTDPNDQLHISHWHFQDGTMLTLWPQGGEQPSDTVSVYPRPDCGVPAAQCKDLVLGRKKSMAQNTDGGGQHNGDGGNSSQGSGQLLGNSGQNLANQGMSYLSQASGSSRTASTAASFTPLAGNLIRTLR